MDFERAYTKAQIEEGKYAVLIEETKEGTFASRCSFALSKGRVTCDRYEMDRLDVDPHVKIKKMYRFASQFSLQLFPSLQFIEDTGRGTVSWGQCNLVSP